MPTPTVILRKWTGRIRTAQQDEYVTYIAGTGLDDYSKTPGNLGFQMLLREIGIAPRKCVGRRSFVFAGNRQLMGTHSDTLFECNSASLEHPTLPIAARRPSSRPD